MIILQRASDCFRILSIHCRINLKQTYIVNVSCINFSTNISYQRRKTNCNWQIIEAFKTGTKQKKIDILAGKLPLSWQQLAENPEWKSKLSYLYNINEQ